LKTFDYKSPDGSVENTEVKATHRLRSLPGIVPAGSVCARYDL
jgi:hypothetical protein